MLVSRPLSYFLVGLCLLMVAVQPTNARPPHKKAVADHFGSLLPKKLNDCILCHLPDPPGTKIEEGDKPHNPFGARLAAVKKELKKAGKGTDIVSRLEAIANEDADGDGVSNLLEILSSHSPGDPKDTPTNVELAAAKKTLVAFLEIQKEYRWKPYDVVRRPSVPDVKNKAWIRNPVDAFIAAEHEKRGLTPRPEAPKHVLLRRLYLDLIGLPPTPEEVQAFVSDPTADAYEKVVDRLLAGPHYGERWGRHWMDVWRYSDWAGYGAEVRDSQPHIWRWRDWIVESLNEDKPYDRMVVEMLAGDEIAPTDPKVLSATGFLVRNWYKFNRDVWLDRSIEHTAKAFLGVTLNCARCHDHFFDPISQKEYYQFRAFFELHDVRTDRIAPELDANKKGLVRVFDAKLDAKTFLYIRGEDKNPDKTKALEPAILSALGGELGDIEPIKLPAEATFPDKAPWVTAALIKARQEAVDKARTALEKDQSNSLFKVELDLTEASLAELNAVLDAEKLEADPKSPAWHKAAVAAAQAQRDVALLTARKTLLSADKALVDAKPPQLAQARKRQEDAALALKKVEEANQKPVTTAYTKRAVPAYPATSSGRRLALAKWIADKDNPRTARVAVNHLWLRHFGKPLVPNAFDFGAGAKPASHPALVDWLAAEFMFPSPLRGERLGVRGEPWSMKRLHRLIVTSAVYRMDSTGDEANAKLDSDNRWLWKMNSRRMEGEIVRDSLLAVAGQLDRTFGGPELDENKGLTTKRRSLYYRHAPEKIMEFLNLFDAANVTECYQRSESIVPQQALALANSPLALDMSRLLARQIPKKLGEAAGNDAFIKSGFEHILGRPPTTEEQAACEEFLALQQKLLADPKTLTPVQSGSPPQVPAASDPGLRARENLIHVLFNHHEFVAIR